jgi:hypothetical protein
VIAVLVSYQGRLCGISSAQIAVIIPGWLYSFILALKKKIKKVGKFPACLLQLFLELLELLLGGLAARSCLLREIFCLGLFHLVQLRQLFLTRWHLVTSFMLLACSICLFSFLTISLYPYP